MIKFKKFFVSNGVEKARVHYSVDNRIDGRKCVTIYAKDYDGALGRVIADGYVNETDTMTDYFEKGRVVLFEGNPLYQAARDVAMQDKYVQARLPKTFVIISAVA